MSPNINTLEQRIGILEKQLADQKRLARIGRAFMAVLVLSSLGFFTIAANSEFLAPDLIKAKRFEVISDDGRLVLALSAGKNGGQLDLWGATGKNVLRAWSNESGGDLAIWNNEAKNVFGAYATETGSETTLFNADGDMVYRVKSENKNARIELLDPEKQSPLFTATTQAGGGVIGLADVAEKTADSLIFGAQLAKTSCAPGPTKAEVIWQYGITRPRTYSELTQLKQVRRLPFLMQMAIWSIALKVKTKTQGLSCLTRKNKARSLPRQLKQVEESSA